MADAPTPDTPDGEHPRVVNVIAECMGETMTAITKANAGEDEAAADASERALRSAEEAVRLLRSLRQLTLSRTESGRNTSRLLHTPIDEVGLPTCPFAESGDCDKRGVHTHPGTGPRLKFRGVEK